MIPERYQVLLLYEAILHKKNEINVKLVITITAGNMTIYHTFCWQGKYTHPNSTSAIAFSVTTRKIWLKCIFDETKSLSDKICEGP